MLESATQQDDRSKDLKSSLQALLGMPPSADAKQANGATATDPSIQALVAQSLLQAENGLSHIWGGLLGKAEAVNAAPAPAPAQKESTSTGVGPSWGKALMSDLGFKLGVPESEATVTSIAFSASSTAMPPRAANPIVKPPALVAREPVAAAVPVQKPAAAMQAAVAPPAQTPRPTLQPLGVTNLKVARPNVDASLIAPLKALGDQLGLNPSAAATQVTGSPSATVRQLLEKQFGTSSWVDLR